VSRQPNSNANCGASQSKTLFVAVFAPPRGRIAGCSGASIPSEEFERHTQIVVSDHGDSPAEFKKGIAGERNWLVADLSTKHDFLKAGLGWGNMPENIVAKDLTAGRLVMLATRPHKSLTFVTSMLRGRGLSPNETWFVDRLADKKITR
jgi:DNA-binding transcriptional LysR family regulator